MIKPIADDNLGRGIEYFVITYFFHDKNRFYSDIKVKQENGSYSSIGKTVSNLKSRFYDLSSEEKINR